MLNLKLKNKKLRENELLKLYHGTVDCKSANTCRVLLSTLTIRRSKTFLMIFQNFKFFASESGVSTLNLFDDYHFQKAVSETRLHFVQLVH